MEKIVENIAKFLSDDTITARMVFYTETKQNSIEAFDIQLYVDAKEALRTLYFQFIDKKKNIPTNIFKPTDHDPNKLQILSLVKIPKSNEVVDIRPERLDKLSPSFINKIKFNSIYFQNSDKVSLIVLRKYWDRRARFLSGSNWKDIFHFIFQDNALKLANKDAIVIDPKIDCVVFDQYVLIFDKNSFEEMFSYDNVYHLHSGKFFDFLETDCDYKISDLDKIKYVCKKGRRLRKVSNVYSSGYYKTVRLISISNINSTYKLGIEIDMTTKRVVFPNPNIFLRLFSDDYLKSELTNSRYVSHNKEKI